MLDEIVLAEKRAAKQAEKERKLEAKAMKLKKGEVNHLARIKTP